MYILSIISHWKHRALVQKRLQIARWPRQSVQPTQGPVRLRGRCAGKRRRCENPCGLTAYHRPTHIPVGNPVPSGRCHPCHTLGDSTLQKCIVSRAWGRASEVKGRQSLGPSEGCRGPPSPLPAPGSCQQSLAGSHHAHLCLRCHLTHLPSCVCVSFLHIGVGPTYSRVTSP